MSKRDRYTVGDFRGITAALDKALKKVSDHTGPKPEDVVLWIAEGIRLRDKYKALRSEALQRRYDAAAQGGDDAKASE